VPDSGGQREIVSNPLLRYSDDTDAVEKIDYIMRTPDLHEPLLGQIAESNQLHRPSVFERSLLAAVEDLLCARSREPV
jgi:hypothetical protein